MTHPNSKSNTDIQQISLPHSGEKTEVISEINMDEIRRELVELEAIVECRQEEEFLRRAA